MKTASLDILDDLLGRRTVSKRTLSELVPYGGYPSAPFSGRHVPPSPDQDRINREVVADMVADWKEESTIVADYVAMSGEHLKDCFINTETGEWFQPGTLLSGFNPDLVKAS